MANQENIDKIPPQNNDAEMAVLGSMLLDREVIGQAIEILNASYFYKEAHKKIFAPPAFIVIIRFAVSVVT